MQRNAKISDALSIEYKDFLEFCASLDKHFIVELTTSDFIAFRTQFGATREYVTEIRKILEDYNSNFEKSTFTPVENSEIEEKKESVITETVQSGEVPLKDTLHIVANYEDVTITDDISEVSTEISTPISDNMSKQLISVNKASSRPSIQFNDSDKEKSFYVLFGIPYDSIYESKGIEELKFSVRTYHCLLRNGCQTCDNLFSKNIQTIGEFENLGTKTLNEIVERCKNFAANLSVITTQKSIHSPLTYTKRNVVVDKKLIDISESIAFGKYYDVSELNDEELKFVNKLKESYKILGKDLYLLALKQPNQAEEICDFLDQYIEQQDVPNKIDSLILEIGDNHIDINLHILPFIHAVKKNGSIDLETVFSPEDRFCDLPRTVEKYLDDAPLKKRDLLASLNIFIDCISSGISDIVNNAYKEAISNDRVFEVMQLRKNGKTLAEIGDLLDITRERVRQIERNMIDRFASCLKLNKEKDIIIYIHALLDGDLMIHKDELEKCLFNENQLYLLWNCIEKTVFNCKTYSYSKEDHAIIFNQVDLQSANQIIQSLPKHIFQDELEAIVKHAVEEEGVLEEKLRYDIEKRYKRFGIFYSERRPTVIFICDWILRNRFINGFKVNDKTDCKRFLDCIREIFGEDSSHMTPRALDAKVSLVGVLCDRGKYIHPSKVTIDVNILDEIDQYIANSKKNAITFIELYEVFKNRLVGTQISNHYFLQGVMKMFGDKVQRRCPYYVFRDYLTKDINISSTDELDTFVRKQGIVHKSEIFAEFPSLNEFALSQVVARCPNVFNIDGGNYIHASQFHIRETDYAPLRAYLTDVTRELPANIRKVFDDCSVRFPEFMDRNELHDRALLFAALYYMFRDDFKFNKPYIANSDDIELTNRGVILGVLDNYDEIAIDELMDILDERGIHYVSLPHLLELIAPEFIRTDENLIMKREHTGIDDDVVEEALNNLRDAIEVNGYLPSCKIEDFIWYPSIDVPWTTYLLESIVLSSDTIDYVPYSYSRSHRSLVVYVNKKYANCDFQSLLLSVIDEEFRKGTFTTKSDMQEWLIDSGFMDVKLPNFLESDQYYFMSDNGLVKREEVEL